MSESNVYIYYRTYPGWSGKNLFAENKFDLIDICWRSLKIEKTPLNAIGWIDNPTEEFTTFLSQKIKLYQYTREGCDGYDSKNRLPVFGGCGSIISCVSS